MDWTSYVVDSALQDLSGKIDCDKLFNQIKSSMTVAMQKESKLTINLTPGAVKVYKALFALEDRTLKADAIAYICGVNKKTVTLALAELKEKGFISYENCKGKVKTYQLLH